MGCQMFRHHHPFPRTFPLSHLGCAGLIMDKARCVSTKQLHIITALCSVSEDPSIYQQQQQQQQQRIASIDDDEMAEFDTMEHFEDLQHGIPEHYGIVLSSALKTPSKPIRIVCDDSVETRKEMGLFK